MQGGSVNRNYNTLTNGNNNQTTINTATMKNKVYVVGEG